MPVLILALDQHASHLAKESRMIFGRKKLLSGWGVLVLAIWLIASGVMALLDISFKWDGQVLAVVAIAAGILLLIDR